MDTVHWGAVAAGTVTCPASPLGATSSVLAALGDRQARQRRPPRWLQPHSQEHCRGRPCAPRGPRTPLSFAFPNATERFAGISPQTRSESGEHQRPAERVCGANPPGLCRALGAAAPPPPPLTRAPRFNGLHNPRQPPNFCFLSKSLPACFPALLLPSQPGLFPPPQLLPGGL